MRTSIIVLAWLGCSWINVCGHAADTQKAVEPFLVRPRSASATFSPNSELCLMSDGALINLSRKNLLNDFKHLGVATFHPNSRLLAMLSNSNFALHDIRLKKDLINVPLAGRGEVGTRDIGERSLFSADGKWFLTTGHLDGVKPPKALFVFDLEKRKLARTIPLGQASQVGLALLPDDQRVLVATDKLRLIDFLAEKTLWERPLRKSSIDVKWFWCDPQGTSIFVWSGRFGVNDNVEISFIENDSPPQVILTAPTLRRVVSAPDGTAVLAIESQGLLLRRVLPDEPVESIPAHEGDASALAMSLDGKSIFTGGEDWRLRIWNAETLEPESYIRPARAAIRRLEVSPNGKYLAGVVGSDTYIWTMTSLQSLAK